MHQRIIYLVLRVWMLLNTCHMVTSVYFLWRITLGDTSLLLMYICKKKLQPKIQQFRKKRKKKTTHYVPTTLVHTPRWGRNLTPCRMRLCVTGCCRQVYNGATRPTNTPPIANTSKLLITMHARITPQWRVVEGEDNREERSTRALYRPTGHRHNNIPSVIAVQIV